jgi:hypothetical protein
MAEDLLRQADHFFAEGDYVRALDELSKVMGSDPDISQRIHTALGRMKLVAAREFAVGRWSVAEGIVDAVQENDRFLTANERAECRTLVETIRKCRDKEKQVHGIVQAAAALAAQNQFAQSREVVLQAMRDCTDGRLVARLRLLLRGFPHPLGRLLYGFDSSIETNQFVRPHGGARVEPMFNEEHPLGGGFASVLFPGPGSRVDFMDPPYDWSDHKELGFTIRLASKYRTTLQVIVGDLQNAWTIDVKLIDPYWNPVRLSFDRFTAFGRPDWRAITRFSISSLGAEPAEIYLDEIRVKPRTS